MRDVTNANFGLLIAYVIPGFILLLGISPFSSVVTGWISGGSMASLTVGGFLYATIAAVAAGLFVGVARWLIVDTVFELFGIREPEWNLSRMRESPEAFVVLVDHQYRYYKAYANSLIAVTVTMMLRWIAVGFGFGEFIVLLTANAMLVAAARNALTKYYTRVQSLFAD